MKLLALLLVTPLVAATPVPGGGFRPAWGYNYGGGSPYKWGGYGGNQPQPVQPQPQPTTAAPQATTAPPPNPPTQPVVYQNSTDWWISGTVRHGKWANGGDWDGSDNTAGVSMFVDANNIAVTVVST